MALAPNDAHGETPIPDAPATTPDITEAALSITPPDVSVATPNTAKATPRASRVSPELTEARPSISGATPSAAPPVSGAEQTPAAAPLVSDTEQTPAAEQHGDDVRRPPPAPLSRVAIEQKLTAAGLSLRRGQSAEARRDVEDVLAAQPRYAAAHEMLGDIEAHLGRFAEACAAYRAALKAEPGRPTAELKLGRTALRATEAAGGFRTLSETSPAVPRGGKAIAGFASALLPGLGQIIRGAYLKGAILLAVYCLANFLILCLPETKDMLRDVGGLLAPSRGAGGAAPIGGLFWFLSFVAAITWLYAVIDIAAAKD